MTKVKQVIVVRKDLDMPAGKLAAQVAHASTGAFLKHFNHSTTKFEAKDHKSYHENVHPWLTHEFTKICVKVNSEAELLEIYQTCIDAKLPCALIKDAGHTVFDQPTLTCLGIGPFQSEELDKVTSHLKLYR